MKWLIVFLIFILGAAKAAGQETGYAYIDEGNVTPPRFLGNESFEDGKLNVESIQDYLGKAINYPEESLQSFFHGTEVVEFLITSDGKLKAFNVLNSVCSKMDEEVINALKATHGKWAPGTVNGTPVDMQQEIAVVFTVCSCNEYMKQVQKLTYKGNNLLYVLNKPEQALKYYNGALCLLPNDESLLAARSLCLYAVGNATGAEKDWERIKVLRQRNKDHTPMEIIAERAKNFPCYEEMMQALQ